MKYNTRDVYELLSNVSDRDISNVEMPTGQAFVLYFSVSYWTGEEQIEGKFRFEVNIHSGNLWLHEQTGNGNELLWENK